MHDVNRIISRFLYMKGIKVLCTVLENKYSFANGCYPAMIKYLFLYRKEACNILLV